MSKNYYQIKKRNGEECQAIDVMREALGSEGFIIFCLSNAFKYVSRIGRKQGEEREKEEAKIKEYIKWGWEEAQKLNYGTHTRGDEFFENIIDNFCDITELGEELKKYGENKK